MDAETSARQKVRRRVTADAREGTFLSDLFSLAGRTALVTGSGSGLGFEMARGLAQAGAHVLLNGRDADRLEAARGQLRDVGAVDVCAFDICDPQAVRAALAGAPALDILVNNVGARDRRPFLEFDAEALRTLLDVDLVAPALLARAVAPGMIARGFGRIINITSIAGPLARAGDAGYTTAKGGLEALTRALAAEFGPHGLTVNAIAPGYFATAPNAAMVADADTAAWLARRTSLGRWGRPEEIAGAAVFLASPAASYITGHVLTVDGGYLAHF
ncbi:MAG: gluconate 5-dehydrogenase [Rhizobiales bacterium 32-66-8]|nr:MAG: gluconate 5-dehydrogenase [Rhizobiales bacterium 32-66-8]